MPRKVEIEDLKKLAELTDKLEDLNNQKTLKLRELQRAIAIKFLWPDVFDNGSVKTKWDHEYQNYVSKKYKPRATKFTIIDGAGNQRSFDPADVPQILNTKDLTGVGTNYENA